MSTGAVFSALVAEQVAAGAEDPPLATRWIGGLREPFATSGKVGACLMAITRRSRLFREVAEATDELLRHARSSGVDTDRVDAALNARIDYVASMMRVGARAAMNYMPADLPGILAGELTAEAVPAHPRGVVQLRDHRRWNGGLTVDVTNGEAADVVDLDARRPK